MLELANDSKAVEPVFGPRQASDEAAEAASLAADLAEAANEGQARLADTGTAIDKRAKPGLNARGPAPTRDPRLEAMANDLGTDFGIGGPDQGHDGGMDLD
jgi:hypothetical protein